MGGTCRCLLACPIFGGDPQKCDAADISSVISDTIMGVTAMPDTQCESIQCIVECSRELRCLNHVVTGRCFNVKENDPTCDVACEDTTTTTSTRSTSTTTSTLTSTTTTQ